jgi:hypothetical protein
MRNKWRLIGIPAWVLAAAAIAYGLVFLTPWFGQRYDSGSGSGQDSKGSYYDGSFDASDPYTRRGVQELAKLQPEQFQETVEALFNNFLRLSEAQLAMLNAAGDDVCVSPLVDCQGVPSKNVKPFIEKALAYKQARESVAIARQSVAIAAGGLDTSRLSLVVSVAAFLVGLAGFGIAMLTYLRKKSA